MHYKIVNFKKFSLHEASNALAQQPRLGEATDEHGKTILHYAAQNINPKAKGLMEMLLDSISADQLNEANNEKATALHLACEAGNLDAVTALLKKGANPNALTINEKSPLICAAAAPYTENKDSIINALLSYGADLNHQDRDGESVYFWLHMYGQQDLLNIPSSPDSVMFDDSEDNQMSYDEFMLEALAVDLTGESE